MFSVLLFVPFQIHISDWFGEDDEGEEDEEALKGHHDGVDVGYGEKLLHWHHQ